MFRGLISVSLALLGVLLGGVYILSPQRQPETIQAILSVGQVLGGDTTGFARAVTPPILSFPRDHGPHPEYRSEWWYYTGNVQTAAGRHFGFQLTFFRSALAAQVAARESAWATAQVYMAHLALTDVETERFTPSSVLAVPHWDWPVLGPSRFRYGSKTGRPGPKIRMVCRYACGPGRVRLALSCNFAAQNRLSCTETGG